MPEQLFTAGSYQPRPTRCVGVSEFQSWKLKRYEIAVVADEILDAAVGAAESVVAGAIAQEHDDKLGIGFVIVHRGSEAVWLLVDLWHKDIICQHAFRAPLETPTLFEPVERGGPTVCLWELEVFIHERDAFIKHIFNKSVPDVDSYLADCFTN